MVFESLVTTSWGSSLSMASAKSKDEEGNSELWGGNKSIEYSLERIRIL